MEEGDTDSIVIRIGGVNFSVRCRNAEMPSRFEPAYTAFLRPAKEPSCVNIDVDLCFGEVPETGQATKLFDTERSWSMSSDGREYFVSLSPPAFDRPVWMARCDAAFEKVTVYCRKMPGENSEGTGAFNPVSYPLDQILLMHILACRSGVILHAAGISLEGRGYIFPGRSGAGKSTLVRQFAGGLREGLLSDDRVIVRRMGEVFEVFGTPWPGEAGIAANAHVPLAGILFIAHGADNLIRKIDRKEAIERLLPLASIPWYDVKAMTDVLAFCEAVASGVPSYVFSFRPDRDVAAFLEEFAAGSGVAVGNKD